MSAHVSGGRRRHTERESESYFELSMEPKVGLDPQTHEITIWVETESCTLNQLSCLGAPGLCYFGEVWREQGTIDCVTSQLFLYKTLKYILITLKFKEHYTPSAQGVQKVKTIRCYLPSFTCVQWSLPEIIWCVIVQQITCRNRRVIAFF